MDIKKIEREIEVLKEVVYELTVLKYELMDRKLFYGRIEKISNVKISKKKEELNILKLMLKYK